MTTIKHPYPEIGKVLVDYESPVHKHDKYIIGDLNKIYEEIKQYITDYIIRDFKLEIFNVDISNKKTGEVVFKADVEFPTNWSKASVDIFASKYLIRNCEYSICGAVSRVVAWIVLNGFRDGHLCWDYTLFNEHDPLESKYIDKSYLDIFKQTMKSPGVYLNSKGILGVLDFALYLTDVIVLQRGTFNSPVWFNVGNCPAPMNEAPQVAACFVTKIEDNMGSIIGQNIVNQLIALGGSGSGCDMTPIRSRKEWIGKQLGRPSGPIGFTGMFDAVLQATRSAGRFRRAAGLVSLKQHHPDIIEYIRFKANEEKKGRVLSGHMEDWDHDFASESQFSIFGTLRVQNINTAVRLTKEFWDCWKDDTSTFPLKDRNGVEIGRYNCKELIREIAQAQLECGDPGVQYDDNINDCNPFLDMGLRFNSSNACQPSFATVLTPNGISTFGKINIGDIIWSGKRWTKVTNKVHTGIKEVFNHYTRAGVFVGTRDHRIIENGVRTKVKNAMGIDICCGIVPSISDYGGNLDSQTIIDGLVLGDGSLKVSVSKSNGNINYYKLLYIGKKDQSYFNDSRINGFITKKLFDILCHSVITTLSNDELPKTYNREIPLRFFGGDQITVRSFLRGLFSANGGMSGPRVILKATSFKIIEQVQQMLSSIGIRSYYTISKAHDIEFSNGIYTTKQSYDLNITADRNKFRDLIGFIQPYKTDRLNKTCNTIGKCDKPIKSNYEIAEIEYGGLYNVFEITVDAPEHTYWTGGLLVSNCSELQYLDNSACNLASLRITAYYNSETNALDYDKLNKDIQIMLMAQDIMIDFAYYPTKEIAEISYKTRNLGLNYGDLGGLLYMMGLPYDSEKGRNMAACITAYFNICALITSKEMAHELGSFDYFDEKNVSSNLEKILKKQEVDIANYCVHSKNNGFPYGIVNAMYMRLFNSFEMRNATVTIFVPQGTVGLASGNMTSGIEPFLSHSYNKDLVGGSNMKMGTAQNIHDIASKHFIENNLLSKMNLYNLVETALGTDGKNILTPDAHIKMMAAVQPFISLAIAKTVNCPSNITVEQIIDLYIKAHDMKLKAVTIYVDGSKVLQPLKTTKTKREDCPDVTSLPVSVESAIIPLGVLVEEATRTLSNLDDPGSVLILGWTVEINGEKFYMKFGWHPDVLDMIWEVWAEQSFAGGTVDGMTKTIAVMISRKLQEGIKLGKYHDAKQEVIKTMSKMTFPPLGLVMWPKGQPPWFSDINSAMSIPNLLAQMIASIDRYPIDMGKKKSIVPESIKEGGHGLAGYVNRTLGAQVCRECGRMMVKHGSGSHCYMCTKCGASVGGCG